MAEFDEHIRSHFNVVHQGDYLSLTLINPNISLELMQQIGSKFKLAHLRRLEITVLEAANFDDELLGALASGLPLSLEQLSLDFTGCESIRGQGLLDLFERVSQMEKLTKLHLDFSEVYDINDITMEGLSMLLQNLACLQDFYLDLYEVDNISEDGYLLLAQAISNLQNLHHLHLDLCANPHLSEDALELIFDALPQRLKGLGFRILDIEQIGGGSFFKLATALSKMKEMTHLNLTISTFAQINHAAVHEVLKSVSQLQGLTSLNLNLSNLNLPETSLRFLSLGRNMNNLVVDLSCNQSLSTKDMALFISRLPVEHRLRSLSLNVDFCTRIAQEDIQTLLQRVCENKSLQRVSFPDRAYSNTFGNECANIIEKSSCRGSLLSFYCSPVNRLQQGDQLGELRRYKQKEQYRRNIIVASCLMDKYGPLVKHKELVCRLLAP